MDLFMPVGIVAIALPKSGLSDRRSITARKSLSAASASPADTSRYDDSLPGFLGASRAGAAHETTAHTAKVTSDVQTVRIWLSPGLTLRRHNLLLRGGGDEKETARRRTSTQADPESGPAPVAGDLTAKRTIGQAPAKA